MRLKKFNGKTYGVEFTATERKAMNLEINRQIMESDEKYKEDVDAMVLYALMIHKGWKKKRLHDFWKAFVSVHNALRDHYLMDSPGDSAWLAHRKLKEIGVDIHQWYEEDAKNE